MNIQSNVDTHWGETERRSVGNRQRRKVGSRPDPRTKYLGFTSRQWPFLYVLVGNWIFALAFFFGAKFVWHWAPTEWGNPGDKLNSIPKYARLRRATRATTQRKLSSSFSAGIANGHYTQWGHARNTSRKVSVQLVPVRLGKGVQACSYILAKSLIVLAPALLVGSVASLLRVSTVPFFLQVLGTANLR
jgi:hypothetical protein